MNNSRNRKQNIFVKLGLATFLCMALLGASIGLLSSHSYATTNTASQNNAISIIRHVFGRYAGQAIRVATCESSLNPNARNSYAIGGSHAAGLFQVLYPSTWYGTSQAKHSPFNMHANVIAAHEIFVRDGYSWREWQCKP